MLAFLGRYGHQPVSVTMRLPVRDLEKLTTAVGELLKEETDPLMRRED